MKYLFSLIIILLPILSFAQQWEGENIQTNNPMGWPYGMNINLTPTGGWAREFSFSTFGSGKAFAVGAYGSVDKLTYGYIGGNSSSDIVHNTPWMVFKPNGNIGIGTTSPEVKLHVKGDVKTTHLSFPVYGTPKEATNNVLGTIAWSQSGILGAAGSLFIVPRTNVTNAGIGFWTADQANLAAPPINRMWIASNGDVGIGTKNTTGYKLSVEGKIRATEVKVYTGWADFVFADDYVLRPLADVEAFIQQNGHLPDVPSAVEVEKEGVNLGETDALLLQKIEELTLYTLQQENALAEKQEKINQLEQRLAGIEKILQNIQVQK